MSAPMVALPTTSGPQPTPAQTRNRLSSGKYTPIPFIGEKRLARAFDPAQQQAFSPPQCKRHRREIDQGKIGER
jgi:hypothetical protein